MVKTVLALEVSKYLFRVIYCRCNYLTIFVYNVDVDATSEDYAPKDSDDDDQNEAEYVSNDAGNAEDEDIIEPVLIYQSDATKKAEHLREVLSPTVVPLRKKTEPLSQWIAKMNVKNSSYASSNQKNSSSVSSSDSDFVDDEWAMMSLNLKIAYGHKRLPSKQPTDDDYANLVDFMERTTNVQDKTDAGMWLNKFITWFDKNPTMKRSSGRFIKAKNVPSPIKG